LLLLGNIMSQYSELSLKREGPLLWLNLNRPKSSNAFTELMIKELCQCLRESDEDVSIHVVILSGEGKHFCAGGDIKAMEERSGMFAGEPNELRERYQKGIQQIPLTIEAMSTPLIAMVNGAAIGAGCDLSVMCDLRLASENAKFGETFCKLALVPGDGGTYFLPRVIGYAKAMEMFLTGKVYSAKEALAMGLVHSLYPHDKLREETQKVANQIASHSPITLKMTKKALKMNFIKGLQESLDLLAAYQGITQRTDEHFDAVKKLTKK
jgi:2-(1,2-epoxy-1,2-dihydrophenyl)acetyl-CoA isomerase